MTLQLSTASEGLAGHDIDTIAEPLSELVNAAYQYGEKGIFDASVFFRTTPQEVRSLLQSDQLLVAFLDGSLAGCIKLVQHTGCGPNKDETHGELGMFALAEDKRKQGLGSKIMTFAENRALDMGCKVMELQLLSPLHWLHDVKEFLRAWYKQRGYSVVEERDFLKEFPRARAMLATEVKFEIMHKPLS
eukprot:m.170129 g.170129  ORF g.170129 m.170129 type:complete len:189 (+) comp14519_c0_seq1:166-732(+)